RSSRGSTACTRAFRRCSTIWTLGRRKALARASADRASGTAHKLIASGGRCTQALRRSLLSGSPDGRRRQPHVRSGNNDRHILGGRTDPVRVSRAHADDVASGGPGGGQQGGGRRGGGRAVGQRRRASRFEPVDRD